MTGIRIGRNLVLDLNVVVEATAVIGKRGRGKTFTAKRIVEECLRAGVTVVVIDPTDVWWGLRSGADGGEKGGLGVYVIGGKHSDLPIRENSGKVLARAVLGGTSMVVVPKGLPKAARRRLVGELLTELYDRAEGTPILVVVDEADEYAPEGARSIGNRRDDPLMLSLGAVEDIVRRGRAGGLGSLLITQRVAVLSKSVLEQSDTLIALGVTGKNDIDAVAGWIAKHAADTSTGKQITASLPSLPRGTAWVWSPEYGVLDRVEVLPISTFDSSRSPKVGEVAVEPKARKSIDLAVLGQEMESFAEQVKADDPAELRKRIAELQAQVRHFENMPVPSQAVEVKVPVLDQETRDQLAALLQALQAFAPAWIAGLSGFERCLTRTEELLQQPAPKPSVTQRQGQVVVKGPVFGVGPAPTRPPPPKPHVSKPAAPHGDVSKPQQKILNALAWFETVRITTPTRGQVAFQARVSPKSSGFERNLSTLRTAGLIDYPSTARLTLTAAGRDAATPPAQPATTDELQQAFYDGVSEPQATLLRTLVESNPDWLDRETLADRAGVSASSSGFERNLSTLRSLGLIDYPERGWVCLTNMMFLA